MAVKTLPKRMLPERKEQLEEALEYVQKAQDIVRRALWDEIDSDFFRESFANKIDETLQTLQFPEEHLKNLLNKW